MIPRCSLLTIDELTSSVPADFSSKQRGPMPSSSRHSYTCTFEEPAHRSTRPMTSVGPGFEVQRALHLSLLDPFPSQTTQSTNTSPYLWRRDIPESDAASIVPGSQSVVSLTPNLPYLRKPTTAHRTFDRQSGAGIYWERGTA